jgi:anti-anti-sigma factor
MAELEFQQGSLQMVTLAVVGDIDIYSCQQLEEKILNVIKEFSVGTYLVLDLRNVAFIDTDGLKSIAHMRSLLHARDIIMMMQAQEKHKDTVLKQLYYAFL